MRVACCAGRGPLSEKVRESVGLGSVDELDGDALLDWHMAPWDLRRALIGQIQCSMATERVRNSTIEPNPTSLKFRPTEVVYLLNFNSLLN